MRVDDARLRRPQRAETEQCWLHRDRGIGADQLQSFHAVDLALLGDYLDTLELGVVGGDDQLAAFPVRHAVFGAVGVKHAAAGDRVARPQGAGRVVHAAVDHLAVSRGCDRPDRAQGFGNNHRVPGAGGRTRDRKPYDAGADHENLHAAPSPLARPRGSSDS